MKLKQIGNLFPDLKEYLVRVCYKNTWYSVEDIKEKPTILDRDIKKIKIRSAFLSMPIKLEVYL